MGLLRRLFRSRAEGCLAAQPRYEALLKEAQRGMNMSCGGDLVASGEAHFVEALARELAGRTEVVAFDVGANCGEYAALLSRAWAALPGLRILAFEPSPSLQPVLATRFPPGGPVYVRPYGLGASEATCLLHLDAAGSGLGSVYARDLGHRGVTLARSEEIRLRPLDDVAREEGVERIDLLKLDVEGHELAVLQGARRMLEEGRIDRIQFEFGGCHIDARVFLRDFWNLLTPRYTLARLLKDGLQPLERYSERLEVFMPTNYVAVRRP